MRRTLLTRVLPMLIACVVVGLSAASYSQQTPAEPQTEEQIDFNRARQLLQKIRNGEKLTPDESAYLDRARELRRQQSGNRPADAQRPVGGKPTTGMVPLTDLPADGDYKGQSGGLYGNGKNEPPAEHLAAAMAQAKLIQPLNAAGEPDPQGKIGLISSGMSNTTQEFQQFLRMATNDREKSAALKIVDGAQGGQEASDWALSIAAGRGGRASPWDVLEQRLKQAGVTAEQVQVLWLKQARRSPASLGEFPQHAEAMKNDLTIVLQEMKRRYPNLRTAYLSSRTYAGYANNPLNPEPYAYEGAFSMRWLIEDQIAGKESLNFDPQQGEVKAPLLLWGPYLWADGTAGRKTDDVVWLREDFAADGTHPSDTGRRKVAELLMAFFKNDPTAKGWFLKAAK